MPDLAAEPLLIGSLVDPGGVSRAKAVPASRRDAFATTGMGASPSWNVFCADDRLAFTARFSVVGDMRLRIDPTAIRDLGDGLSWGPVTVAALDGTVAASCTRSTLTRAVDRLAAAGITASVGHELEFVLFPRDDQPNRPELPAVASPEWSAYGLGAIVDHAAFLQDVLARGRTAGLDVQQAHAEWAPRQFELSLPARPPVEAADDLVLARMIVSLAARKAGFAASFSPIPVAGGASSGAHVHLSLHTTAGPLFSGGTGPHGVTDAGAAAIAGVLAALPDIGAVLSGSPLSAERLKPGLWAGAHASWGLENREAAVRFVEATVGTPDGANIEVKPIDASANPYLATALVLEGALIGIKTLTPLPAAVDVASGSPGPASLLPTSTQDQVSRMEASAVARRALGADLIEAIAAVRRMEHEVWDGKTVEERVERFRFTWG
ncbi:MAG TPA: glutamine synthetase family protein [Microbacterium sp.]|nr:glutamine synthetase family protein [Microbacterium sp.]